jgi:hypothetical protein
MKRITREKIKVDRVVCPWLIRHFVDLQAEFLFLPHDTNWSKIDGGTVFDGPNCELGHSEAFLPQKRDGKIARSLRARRFAVW